ncbi:hypothetical protein QHH11_23995 [Aphanizomenon sp. PH219]|uniref:Uncharacterized protein n=1 Tax=Dolichospermum heterosporum TAC447 TaxID=747523 RepID=A0ABY5LZG9_9CYAN|nr:MULTISPECIES: hypothetical protein [Aphanizomenonaceae]MDK2411687.1 hypothetical protein [Aphanizomenon sp. 202]MDK2462148.1 hypothetical protein [Aphanizomenon sp. PH219]UUO15928.1 hypothetical protein NG743_02395 [Dolichospermum heterosporum TAC447]
METLILAVRNRQLRYLQTRTALQYIFAGKINDLKQVSNWQLLTHSVK